MSEIGGSRIETALYLPREAGRGGPPAGERVVEGASGRRCLSASTTVVDRLCAPLAPTPARSSPGFRRGRPAGPLPRKAGELSVRLGE